ncbi:transglycosylase SLT domain-containing protein [Caenispirillum salinarum]|uniref:lytic transglycosylase domain-containing protein n=1 Tax=Caenispirillum salinarum TaxID=859058 RepID=UPI00384D722D
MRTSAIGRTRTTTSTTAAIACALALGAVILGPAGGVPQAAAATGAAQRAFDRAVQHHHGEGAPKDLARAQRLYCQAGRSGHAEAAFTIGWMFLNGRETPQSDAQGAAWMAAAKRAGHPTAGNVLKMLGGVETARVRHCPTPQSNTAVAGAGTGTGGGARLAETSRLALRPPPDIDALARRIAAEYDIAPELVLAVIAVESAWRPDVVSHAGAQGLMQLIPETAARFGVRDPFDPEQNVRGGTRYLRWLLSLFRGDVTRALAAYNAGERAVLRYGGIPPYEETQNYVVKVRRYYQAVRHPYDAALVGPDVRLQISQAN